MMKKKAGVVVSSAAAIAICAGLVVGSTLAMLSSESSVNIAATSGNLNVTASIGSITASSSLRPDYRDSSDTTVYFEAGKAGTEEGDLGYGYAHIENGTVTLNNITPGDSLSFEITFENSSSIPILYATTYSCNNGYLLAHGLSIEIDGESQEHVQSFTSAWRRLEIGQSPDSIAVKISLPNRENETDNGYQGLSTNFSLTVEAVQSNAEALSEASYVPFPEEYATLAKLNAEKKLTMIGSDGQELLTEALSSREDVVVVLGDDLQMGGLPIPAGNTAKKTVDLNGHTLTVDSANGSGILANSSVSFMNGKIIAKTGIGIGSTASGAEVTLKNVALTYQATGTAVYFQNGAKFKMLGGSLSVTGAKNGGVFADNGANVLLDGVDYKLTRSGVAFAAQHAESAITMQNGRIVMTESEGLIYSYVSAPNGTIEFINVKNVVDGKYTVN